MNRAQQVIACAAILAAVACERAKIPTATPEGARSAATAASTDVISESDWGFAGNEATQGAAVASDGSSYLVGFTTSFEPAERVFVLKFGADGSLTWQRTWDGPSQFFGDRANDVAIARDGSVYVVGSTLGNGGDALILKFSSGGTLLWQKTWGTPTNDPAQAVAVGSDGSVYVTGSTRNAQTDALDLFVIKLAPDGALVWQKIWGTADGSEEGQGVAVGPDGNIYVAGVAPRPADPFQFQFDAVVLKLDPAGTLLWQRAFAAGDVLDARGGVDVAADGSVYVAGGFQGPLGNRFSNNVIVLKLTADGSLAWARRWGGDSGDFPEDVAVAPDGSIAVVGGSNSFGQGINDAFLLRLEPGGKPLDARTWGGAGIEQGSGVGVATDGTISMGGRPERRPYVFAAAPTHTAKLKISVSSPLTALVNAAGVVSDAGGVVATPAGSTTYAGGFDAVLVRITP